MKYASFISVMTLLLCSTSSALAPPPIAQGVVFGDTNGNGIFDESESGIKDVLVSNGRQVVSTEHDGRWRLPVSRDCTFFVIKPAGYDVPVDEYKVPRYYYIHKPDGSPENPMPGVAPTGKLPISIDFPLVKTKKLKSFKAIISSDPQSRGIREVNFLARDIVPELIGTDAVFGITLGDIVADDPALFGPQSEAMGQIGIPWYYVFGNHDHNRGAKEPYVDEAFEKFFGPSTYAFNYGDVLFISYRNVQYGNTGGSSAVFLEQGVEFTKNLLRFIPEDRMVVLMMHIPIVAAKNKNEIYDILSRRPNSLSISGHTHEQASLFLSKDEGWNGSNPHHHYIIGTSSGSWWCGAPDETGIPHATMNDGTPNGYAVLTFTGSDYEIEWKGARKPADYQMDVYFPDEIIAGENKQNEILVNYFMGSKISKVEMSVGDGSWITLEQTKAIDPKNLMMHERNTDRNSDIWGWDMDKPSETNHIWKGDIPNNLPVGTYKITIRASSSYTKTYYGKKLFRVVNEASK